MHAAVKPMETFFVVDAMTGQDAVNTAKAFNDALPLTGVILTKVDGDTRGGAALSVRKTIGKPIKFLGVGEKIDGFEPFHPDRLASRILGMGDMLSLIEEAERKMDKGKADNLVNKMQKGERFDLDDLLDQFRQLKKMGGVMNLLDKLPFLGADFSRNIQQASNDKMFGRMEAIVLSMTKAERRDPDIIDGSRKRRIAGGSGTDVNEVNRLLKQHKQMQKMFKKVSKKGSVDSMVKNLQGMMGNSKMRPPF
jgi:signal recognition particle subunit SRP54